MKRIPTKKNSFLKRLLINIPFVLIVALAAACFAGGGVLVFYCFVTAAAFNSAMISLILVGAGLVLVGAGLGLVLAFKRYYAFYDKQMGWEYPGRPQVEQKTEVQGKKPLKEYFSLSNFALGFLLLGAIFTIISAALGCISRDKWIAAVGPYRESKGLYADVKRVDYPVFIEDPATHEYELDSIELNLISKDAVIVFTDDEDKLGKITVKAYLSYEHQVDFFMVGTKFTVKENPAPERSESTLDKLMFFADYVLRAVPSEKQIVIYLPYPLKDNVEIKGEYILAK